MEQKDVRTTQAELAWPFAPEDLEWRLQKAIESKLRGIAVPYVTNRPTTITGGNGQGKTSITDAIAFAVTGQPFFGKRGIDKLHNEVQPKVSVSLRFVDEKRAPHELTWTRHKNRMTIHYDGYEIRQMDLTDMFGERDVFLSIFNPLYFIEELGDEGKNLLEMHLPMISSY